MSQKKNNILFAITVIILCVLIVIILSYDRNKTKNFVSKFDESDKVTEVEKENSQKNEEKENENKTDESKQITQIPTIYCVGDSTTIGSENQNNSYVT